MRLKTIDDLHNAQDQICNKIESCNDIKEIKDWEWSILSKAGKALALIYADFSCECCIKDTDLTLHHLVDRTNREFIGYKKYLVQRHKWYNLAILCTDCHSRLNGFESEPNEEREMKSISSNTLKFAKLVVMNSLKENITEVNKNVKGDSTNSEL